ncbi:MAG: PhaM family polyhydroxyalkanoate granule multifunctional regulatory protein [Burkholderiaceae bacterium]
MSDANLFGKFVPGFDFLQSLAKGAAGSIPQMPSPASWVAPTLNVEELDKRISELKTVQFWLEQNGKALAATITALEVQKMTLATLKGMNFNMGDLANAFKLKAADTMASAMGSAKEKVAETAAPQQSAKPAARKKPNSKATAPSASATGLIDPMQLWGSLTQQFSQIASSAMKDAAKQTAIDTTKNMAKAMTETALHTAKTAGTAAAQTMQRMASTGKSSATSGAPKKRAANVRTSTTKGKK